MVGPLDLYGWPVGCWPPFPKPWLGLISREEVNGFLVLRLV